MGSLLPLSNSSVGRNRSFSEMPFDRRIEKTEAESVDDMTAASSIDSSKPNWKSPGRKSASE